MIDTLYMERPASLIASMSLHRHAVGLGLRNIVSDFHVTLAYSRAPVDWHNPIFTPMTNFLTLDGGERRISKFGDYVVLEVESGDLQKRWASLVMAGASWDFPSYKPHITLGIDPDFNAEGAPVYRGQIVLQGERREQVKEDA